MSRRCYFVVVLPNVSFLCVHCPFFCICLWALGRSMVRTVPFVAVPLGHLFSLTFWSMSFYINCHHCSNKVDGSEIYTNLWIEKYQIRWQFDSMIIQQNNSSRFTRGLWAPQPWAICQIFRTRHAFPLIELALHPIRKQLIAPITSMPLLHPRDHLAKLVIM